MIILCCLFLLVLVGCDKFEKDLKSAKKGNAAAQFNVAVSYLEAKGVSLNTKKGIEWLKKSAEQGYAKGQALLGLCYYWGKGVPKNNLKALEWLKKSANQGNATGKKAYEKLRNQ